MAKSKLKSTSTIISGYFRAWMKQSRSVKFTNSKAGGRMKAWRLVLSAIRLLRMAVCPVQAVNIAGVSMLEMKKHQLFG